LGGGADDRGGASPGGVDLDEVARAQVVSAARLHLAVDGHVPGLDEFAGLRAVFRQGGELDELPELDGSAHGDRGHCHDGVLSLVESA